MQLKSLIVVAALLASLSPLAVLALEVGENQWSNAGYSASGAIPYNLPSAPPQLLFNITYSTNAAATPVVDAQGNAWFMCDTESTSNSGVVGICMWSPANNSFSGPIGGVISGVSFAPALAPDAPILYVPHADISASPKLRISAFNLTTLMATSDLVASTKWTWTGNSNHHNKDNIGNVPNFLYAEKTRVLFGGADAWVASLNPATGAAYYYVNTAEAYADALSSTGYRKIADARIFPSPANSNAYWLRVDGTLFKINKDTGAFTVVSLANMTQIPESYFGIVDYWQETVLRIDDINGNIYIAAKNADQYPEYPSLFVFDADLNLLSNVTYSGLFSLPVFGSIGGDRFFANAVPQAQILNQTLESIHTTNRNSQSPLIFNSASGLALLPDGAGAAAADLTVFNLTALEDVYTITAPVANRFSPGYLLAVDATGRLISTGVDRARAIYGYFSVWGCPLGQSVHPDGNCADGCPAPFIMENNACVIVPAPAAPPVDSPVNPPADAPVEPPHSSSGFVAASFAMVIIAAVLVCFYL